MFVVHEVLLPAHSSTCALCWNDCVLSRSYVLSMCALLRHRFCFSSARSGHLSGLATFVDCVFCV